MYCEGAAFLQKSISSAKSSQFPHASQPKHKPLKVDDGGGEPRGPPPPFFWEVVRFLPPPPPPSGGEEEDDEETEEARPCRNAAARAASAVRPVSEGSVSALASTKEPSIFSKRQLWRWSLTNCFDPEKNLATSSPALAPPPDDDDDAAPAAPARLNAARDLTSESTSSQFSRRRSFSFG